MLTEDDVICGFRAILMRDPPSHTIAEWLASGADRVVLRRTLLDSVERMYLDKGILSQQRRHENWDVKRKLEHASSVLQTRSQREFASNCDLSPAATRFLSETVKVLNANVFLNLSLAHFNTVVRQLARQHSSRSIFFITLEAEADQNQPGRLNPSSPEPISLMLQPSAALSALFFLNVVPEIMFVDTDMCPELIERAYSLLPEQGALVCRIINVSAPIVSRMERFVPDYLGEIFFVDDFVISTRSHFPLQARYEPTAPEPVTKGPEQIGLATIIKNEEKLIAQMLLSCVDAVDFVLIVDTGSKDNSIAIAVEILKQLDMPYKIESIDFVDFAHARNFAINNMPDHLTWTFMLDADEYIVEEDKSKLRNLITIPDVDAWALPRYNFSGEDRCGPLLYYPDRQVRLFRNTSKHRPRFVNAVHEALHDAGRRGSAPANAASIGGGVGGPHIHHVGMYKSARQAAERLAQNRALAAAHNISP